MSDPEASDPAEATAPPGDEPPPARGSGPVLRGTPIAAGLALGVVHRKDQELEGVAQERVPLDGVETELNRFHRAVLDARAQLASLRDGLVGRVAADEARILDVHVAYLKDSVFISDVENLILTEQLRLEAAIAKVISDFDRIFRLVQNQTLRERAVDLRDVGIRVLRQLERQEQVPGEGPATPDDYVLVARELSIVDMFNLHGESVLAILTEEGGLTSHAAMLARSMRIPTLTGVRGLLETVNDGDFVIVDASEGLVRVDPEERVRAQYLEARSQLEDEGELEDVPAWAASEPRTLDGERLEIAASCGSLPEVEQAVGLGMRSVGLYRTELLYMVDREPPTRETLTRHYSAVLGQARGAAVTFRLLHADSSLELGWMHDGREPNPALGRAGVRALLAREEVLRRQVQALMRAAVGGDVSLLVPFVTDAGELRRVKEILFEERLELKKTGEPHAARLPVGVVLETPASFLGVRDLARECDFLVLALDSCLQYLLAVDRENGDLSSWFESLHPFVLRAVADVVRVCDELGKPLSIFGFTSTQAHNLPFLVGLGLRRFLVPPIGLREFLSVVGRLDVRSAKRAARAALEQSCQAETLSLVDGYRHGYAR